jgi:hypothetical protein
VNNYPAADGAASAARTAVAVHKQAPEAAKAGSYLCELPLPAERALIVTGSLFAKAADRILTRDAIWPVQVLIDGRAFCARAFLPVGKLGVSSFAFPDPHDAAGPIFYSSGDGLCELRGGGTVKVHAIPHLVDVHEILWHRGSLQIANTARDEVVSFTPATGAYRRRPLARFRCRGRRAGQGERLVDRFHVNQAFGGLDGDLWALVHHVAGTQSLLAAVGGVIKRQGDGGVLNLDRGIAVKLDLSGPHSVRVVGDEYWVMNSGAREVVVYSRQWQRLRAGPSLGWGRGLAIDGDLAYGGMTPTRKRYLSLLERFDPRCRLQAFALASCEGQGQALIRHVEQINNVYCVHKAVGMRLLSL